MSPRPLPPGAWDTHAHVIGDPARWPLWGGRGYEPPFAPLEAYLAMLDRHGLARGVLVQPSVYGFDNGCMLDALDRAEGRLVGVAVPPPDTSAADLEALHRRGVRGIRCNVLNPGGLDPGDVGPWAPVLRDLGWHVALQLDVGAVTDLRGYVGRLADADVPVVVGHMGRPRPGTAAPDAPGPRRLVELVAEGVCRVKLSAPYRLSDRPAPWADVTPLARALLAADPARCLFATDWPHTDTSPPVETPDLFDALDAWCPDEATRRVLLVEAPGALLGEG